ncbi:hypothetical protein HYU50_04245 [Candidatus Woesearchaeota archaeon]|nr:hypothetical protein [Candidatus Woesearchaeota archaeon]
MVSGSRVFNKRGVSPLIATVLLISFAVALGSVVLNWGKNLDISRSGDACSGAAIKIRNIGEGEVCYSGSGSNISINFILDNPGDVDVVGLSIWIVGDKGTKLLDLDNIEIKSGELLDVKDDRIKYDFNTYGMINYVQFIPRVKAGAGIDICPKNSVKAEKIGSCQ